MVSPLRQAFFFYPDFSPPLDPLMTKIAPACALFPSPYNGLLYAVARQISFLFFQDLVHFLLRVSF